MVQTTGNFENLWAEVHVQSLTKSFEVFKTMTQVLTNFKYYFTHGAILANTMMGTRERF